MGNTKNTMRLIAHRGNVNGPSAQENHPDHIKEALNLGFEVEIDVWVIDGEVFYGHDGPQYKGTILDLDKRCWLHCKNLEALRFFSGLDMNETHAFWHDVDDYALTNKKYIWTNIGRDLSNRSIMVMPEVQDETLKNTIDVNCSGICSDWVQKIKVMRT